MLIKKMFTGRAGRLEFLVYLLIEIIINIVLLYLKDNTNLDDEQIMYIFYSCLLLLIPFIPLQAVATRRIRDLRLNGGWIFINFIPIINIPFKIFLCIAKGKSAGSASIMLVPTEKST
jgi:uncharacterized membrane protein YhaH (DUF805 family)